MPSSTGQDAKLGNENGKGPARSSSRIRRTAWRRGQILRAATELLEREGFHGMSMSSLAERAGMSVGLVYQYVSSKEDVLELVIVDILEAFSREIPPAIALHDDPPTQLYAAFAAYCGVIDSRRPAVLLTYRESKTLNKAAQKRLMRLEEKTTRLLADVVDRGVKAGDFIHDDPYLVAYDLAFLAHMWGLKYWYWGRSDTLDEYVSRQYDFVVRSISTAAR